MASKADVTIYGAGMSGLVAAIDLARKGYGVVVHDREKGYGGDSIYNPSTHTTGIDVGRTSEYVGIDLSPVFHPLARCPFYFHETVLEAPLEDLDMYTVERGNRPTSLDTLLYGEALKLGVEFRFDSPLRKEDLPRLPENTIVACGLTPSVYEMLGIPYLRWYGWISRGEIGFSNISWIWIDEVVTEYGYLSSCNNFYFDLLFSIRPIDRAALKKYSDFMARHEGVEHREWRYVSGAVPIAAPDNPRLFHRDLILCGTISGAMDPFFWFGILGALISGKVAAMAVYDRSKALEEFERFNRGFKAGFLFKQHVWYRIRPHVSLLELQLRLLGPQRLARMVAVGVKRGAKFPFNLPGFSLLGNY
ncbi:MAG: NAD(P)-binding protein [Actinobacteria bacterium]|nr:NAD(P)-binding protein [Actinomycetota bacterium]